MKQLIILSMTACLLAGCGIYPNYSRPDMEVKERYRNVETADTTTIASLSWRELFTDIRLQVLIEQGLQQNTDFASESRGSGSRADECPAFLPAVAYAESRSRYRPIRRYDFQNLQSECLGKLGTRYIREEHQCQTRRK